MKQKLILSFIKSTHFLVNSIFLFTNKIFLKIHFVIVCLWIKIVKGNLNMNCVIHVIETHPYKDNIAFTADYKGEVSISH